MVPELTINKYTAARNKTIRAIDKMAPDALVANLKRISMITKTTAVTAANTKIYESQTGIVAGMKGMGGR